MCSYGADTVYFVGGNGNTWPTQLASFALPEHDALGQRT